MALFYNTLLTKVIGHQNEKSASVMADIANPVAVATVTPVPHQVE